MSEEELGFGLGPVAADHVGHGPVVVVGDEDVFAEQFFFQLVSGLHLSVRALLDQLAGIEETVLLYQGDKG